MSIAQPGMTLCLASGTYTAGNGGLLLPPRGRSGTSSQPITVAALDERNPPVFDGQFSGPAVSLVGNSWWNIQGINAKHGSYEVLRIGDQSNNVTVRRVVAWDAHVGGNNAVCGIHYVNGPVLFEDVACFGTGRKTIAPTQGVYNFTCRRC